MARPAASGLYTPPACVVERGQQSQACQRQSTIHIVPLRDGHHLVPATGTGSSGACTRQQHMSHVSTMAMPGSEAARHQGTIPYLTPPPAFQFGMLKTCMGAPKPSKLSRAHTQMPRHVEDLPDAPPFARLGHSAVWQRKCRR